MPARVESNAVGETEVTELFWPRLRDAIYSGREDVSGHSPYSPELARQTAQDLVHDLAAAGLPVDTAMVWTWPWGLIIELRGDAVSCAQLMIAIPVFRDAMTRDDVKRVRTRLRHMRKQLKLTLRQFQASPSCFAEFSEGEEGIYLSIDISGVACDSRFRQGLVDELLPAIETDVVMPLLRTITGLVKGRLSLAG